MEKNKNKMNTQKKSFLYRISPKNYSIGIKLNVFGLLLVIISILVANVISLKFFRNNITKTNIDHVEQEIVNRKNAIETQYGNLIKAISDISNESLGNDVSSLNNSFNSFINDLQYSSASWNDSLKLYDLAVANYYSNFVINKIKYNKPTLESIAPTEKTALALQYYYLVNNPYAFNENYSFEKSPVNSDYNSQHKNFHEKIQRIVRKTKFQNVYLIEGKKGNVIYSYKKNIATGRNIYKDYLKHTDLALAFQKALLTKPGSIVTLDYNYYIPEFNKPVAFFSIPLLKNGNKNAVLVFELSSEFFSNELMQKEDNLHKSDIISFSIVGKDKKLRSSPVEELYDKEEFTNNIKKFGDEDNLALLIKTGAMALSFNNRLSLEKNETYTGLDYLNRKSFINSLPLNLNGFDWYIVAAKDHNNAFSFLNKIISFYFFELIVLSIISILITYAFRLTITKRLISLRNNMKKLIKGEPAEKVEGVWNDEIKDLLNSFNELHNRIDNASHFALQLSSGDYKEEFKAVSKTDNFAQSLNTLKEALVENKQAIDLREQEDKIRNWTNEGIAKFNDLLRQSNNDIKNLAYIIIESLIEYVHANIGGIFLVEGETEKYISLIASFAYDRRKSDKKRIEIGEGLIGNCYLEKKPIYLTKLPQDYMEIGSGMGKTDPNVLYIVPLLYDQEVLGFLEIASLEEFKKHEIDFIKKLAENIAATFSSVRLNTKTAVLLEESKRRANEIAQQEEEMRQNLEEMQATQEELARLRDEDEQKTKELKTDINKARSMVQELVNSMTGEVYVKDSNGVIILANEEIAKRFNTTPQKLIGKTDNDIYTNERAEKEQELDSMVLKEGIFSDEIIELVGTEERKYFVVKKQFHLPITKETGVITIRNKR
jgi:PAS domain-containing protein/HAMP domain-containing protein